MRPSYLPRLINGSGGDPALYIDSQFERRAFLFGAGEFTALAAPKLLRIGDVFISHMHGPLHRPRSLVRVMLGGDERLALYGPPGLIEQTAHKLAAYTRNLAHNYRTGFTLLVRRRRPFARRPRDVSTHRAEEAAMRGRAPERRAAPEPSQPRAAP